MSETNQQTPEDYQKAVARSNDILDAIRRDQEAEKILAKRMLAMQKVREESFKLVYDCFKHTTTISTGSILIILALLEKIFKSPSWKFLVAVALGSFILCIVSSLAMMHFVPWEMLNNYDFDEYPSPRLLPDYVVSVAFILNVLTFLLGIVCMAVFAVRNLYP